MSHFDEYVDAYFTEQERQALGKLDIWSYTSARRHKASELQALGVSEARIKELIEHGLQDDLDLLPYYVFTFRVRARDIGMAVAHISLEPDKCLASKKRAAVQSDV